MRTTRVTWLIALTVAATTLPGRAWSSPAHSRPATQIKRAASSALPRSRDRKNGTSKEPKIAPNAEWWDGSSSRASGKLPTPILIEGLAGHGAGLPIAAPVPVLTDRHLDREPVFPQRSDWLVCRYAHAPPRRA